MCGKGFFLNDAHVRALAEAGAGRVYVLTLARTEKRERAATGEDRD